MRALIVIPTREEAANLPVLLPRVRSAAPDAGILIVDDESADGTADIAEQLGTSLGGIEVLRRRGKPGLGPAYVAGFSHGLAEGYDIFVAMDADLSHPPESLPSLLREVASGADVAIGSRYVPDGAVENWPLHRRLLSQWGNRYASTVLRLHIADATSGFRAFTAAAVREVVGSATRASGYGFQVEQLYRLRHAGASLHEVPITFTDRVRGSSKMNGRIIVEAMALVTLWGLRDCLRSVSQTVRSRT